MDNLTHTMAGLLLAEAAVQIRARPSGTNASFRAAAYFASAFVNNVPDLDFVYAGITARPFGYLLHHRGHSHTVPIGLALGIATAAAILALAKRRTSAWSRSERIALLVLCSIGPLVHMAMDFSNNYGVRPFWPVYSGAFYGDAVFIVEPFFWAVGLPSLVFAARTRGARFVLATILVLGLVACWGVALAPEASRIVARPMALAVTIAALVSTLVAWRLGPKGRIGFALAASLLVAVVFFGASSAAKAAVRQSPAILVRTIHDIVITPMPANPFCSTALVVATEGDEYVVARARVSTVPSILPSDRCPRAAEGDPTAPLSPIAAPSTPSVTWKDEFRAPRRALVDLAENNCQAAALLKFMRVPYWMETTAGELVLGDLRYDRTKGLDFSDVTIEMHPTRCPGALPPWIPPRLDVLGAPDQSRDRAGR